jgi:SAM-dependent methyltransferase
MRTTGLSLYSRGVAGGKLQLMDAYLTPGNTLDIGCGNGLYGLYAASRGSEVLQIDLEDRRDDRARCLPFRSMDAQRLNFPDKEYANILAFDIMEHLDDDELFLQEVRRVCHNRVLLSVPNADDEQPAKIALTHIHHKDKTHRREYTRDGLSDLLKRAGFQVMEIRPNLNPALPYFARALAKDRFAAKIAAKMIGMQCKLLENFGLFENKTIGDWYCAAEAAR